MPNPELAKYVADQRAAGYTDDQLRQALSAQGWGSSEIYQVLPMAAVAGAAPVVPTPSAIPAAAEPVTYAGQGSLVPPKGWSWGAATFGWIWGIRFKVWLAFLGLVPLLNGIWWIVLGIKGREWAWKAAVGKDPDQVTASMKKWDKWGLIIFILGFVVGIAGGIFAALSGGGAATNLNTGAL